MGVIFGTQLVLSDRHSVFKNMQDSEVEISLSTEGHFWKPSSVSTVCCCIHKCKLRCKVSNNVEKLDAFFQINTEKMHIDVCITEHGASNLHICAGTIDAEQYKLVMEDQRWPSRCRLFQRKASNHILHILQQHSSVWKEPKCSFKTSCHSYISRAYGCTSGSYGWVAVFLVWSLYIFAATFFILLSLQRLRLCHFDAYLIPS